MKIEKILVVLPKEPWETSTICVFTDSTMSMSLKEQSELFKQIQGEIPKTTLRSSDTFPFKTTPLYTRPQVHDEWSGVAGIRIHADTIESVPQNWERCHEEDESDTYKLSMRTFTH